MAKSGRWPSLPSSEAGIKSTLKETCRIFPAFEQALKDDAKWKLDRLLLSPEGWVYHQEEQEAAKPKPSSALPNEPASSSLSGPPPPSAAAAAAS